MLAGYNLTVDGSNIHELIYDHGQYINYHQVEDFLKENMGSAFRIESILLLCLQQFTLRPWNNATASKF